MPFGHRDVIPKCRYLIHIPHRHRRSYILSCGREKQIYIKYWFIEYIYIDVLLGL